MGELRRRLDCVKDKTRGVDQALRELLDADEDLRRLEISRFWQLNQKDSWERPSRNANAEDVEILLECYEQEIDALLKVDTIDSYIHPCMHAEMSVKQDVFFLVLSLSFHFSSSAL